MKKTILLAILTFFTYSYIELFIVKPFFTDLKIEKIQRKKYRVKTGNKLFRIEITEKKSKQINSLSSINIELILK